MQLINAFPIDLLTYVNMVTKCEQLSSQMKILSICKKSGRADKKPLQSPTRRPKSPTRRTEIPRENKMEWEPIEPATVVSNNAANKSRNINGYPSKCSEDKAFFGKRAKWVELEEIKARRDEGRCLRCGRSNCKSSRYPLAAPIRPKVNVITKPKFIQVLEASVKSEDESIYESGKD
jgi:hypothetical protein